MKQTREHIQKRVKARYGYKHSEETKRKISSANKGKRLGYKHSEETKEKIGSATRDEKHGHWKGDDVGLNSLHVWVVRRLGRPTTCEFCGKNDLKGPQIHWANKSGEYKRDLDDWLRLCVKCHREYDGSNKNRKRGKDGKFIS